MKIYLVGAGPGDPELITMKALRLIQQADIILYDALANEALLKNAPILCTKIFVGKRRGYRKFSQNEICDILVKAAKNGHKTIVRLKGGDPLVFARSLEEMEAITKNGFEYEIVPGISSFAAAMSSNNIPLTQRKMNQSFWVLTGTTAKNKMNHEIQLAAQSNATVLILMGMQFLEKIVELFMVHKGPDFPIAIMQNVSLPYQKNVFGTLENILELREASAISNPAIIALGETLLCKSSISKEIVLSEIKEVLVS